MYTTRKQRINGFDCGFYDFRPQIKSREKMIRTGRRGGSV